MKNTIILRKKMGLSQRQLAAYLGIAKSTLGMYERARGSLPVAVLEKLAYLETQIAAWEKTGKPVAQVTQENSILIDELEKLSLRYRKALALINKRLRRMQKTHTVANAMFLFYPVFIAGMPDDNKRQKFLLEIIHEEKKRVLTKMNPASVFLLELEAKHLQLLYDLTSYYIRQIREGAG